MDNKEVAGFDWDEGNIHHCQKHGVELSEIEELFLNHPQIYGDPYPDETRLRAIGRNNTGRYMYVVFMFRERHDEVYIRPISARFMHQKEIDRYEKR